MDLKDFIKAAVTDISQAINEINEELGDSGAIVNPKDVHVHQSNEEIYGYVLKPSESKDLRRPVHLVKFDIAVTSATKKDGKEGIGVNVVGIKLGKDGSNSDENSTNSRLQFAIPIALPVGKR